MIFGGIDSEYEALEKAAFVVVPVPYDLTTTYQGGARKGPSAILEASPDFLAAQACYRMMGYLSKKS